VLGRIDDGTEIIGDRLTIETTLSYVIVNNLEIYGRLPIIADQDTSAGFEDSIDTSGIGTPTIGARLGILQQRTGAPVSIAIAAEVWPTWGTQDVLAKESGVAAQFRAEAGRVFGNVVFGGQIGVLDREEVKLGASALRSELQGGLVVAMAKGALRPELSVRGAQPFGSGPPSAEALAGLRAFFGPVEGFLLGGPGFFNAPGTPQWRGLAGLAYKYEPVKQAAPAAPPPPPPPPPDPCAPGQTHTPDQCPNLDDDGDGIINSQDGCPLEKGIAETRGCPPKDTDGDTVPDHLDKCPDQAGAADNEGCPRAKMTVARIEIMEKVLFDTGKSTIRPESSKLLDDIAAAMKAHPEVTKVSVEGHTDDVGAAKFNQRLSQARANAVVAALVERGVEKERLEAKGLGETQPVAPNDTAEGRDANRRVEFVITGREEPK
jgi:outer membrane protein OmpA-like peptidoglycan-associated protein